MVVPKYRQSCLPTNMHAYIYTNIHACPSAYIHKYLHANMHACTHACLATYIHTYIQTYMHKHKYTYKVMHVCLQTNISTCIKHICITIFMHICMKTYTLGDSCMPDKQIDTDVCLKTCMHIYIHRSPTFQPRNTSYFIVQYYHNFQVHMFSEFPYCWKYRNVIILE